MKKYLSLTLALMVSLTMCFTTTAFAAQKSIDGFAVGEIYSLDKSELTDKIPTETITYKSQNKKIIVGGGTKTIKAVSKVVNGKKYTFTVKRSIPSYSKITTLKIWQNGGSKYKQTNSEIKGKGTAKYIIEYPSVTGYKPTISVKCVNGKTMSTSSTRTADKNVTMTEKSTKYDLENVSCSITTQKNTITAQFRFPQKAKSLNNTQKNGKIISKTHTSIKEKVVTIKYQKAKVKI